MGSKKRTHRPKNNSRRIIVNESAAAGLKAKSSARGRQLSSLLQPLRALVGPSSTILKEESDKTESRGANLWARLLKAGGIFCTVSLVIVITTVLFSDAVNKDAVIIAPFGINSEFQSKAYDGQAVAKLLTHNISIMIQEAKSVKRSQEFEVPLSTELPDVQVPVGNVSAKGLKRYVEEFAPFQYLKRHFGLNPIRVNGEALLQGDEVRINLRITKDVAAVTIVEAKTFTRSLKEINLLIAETSQYIMAYTEPYLWAVYLYRKGRSDEALAQIQYSLHRDPEENTHMALTLWGLILLDQKNMTKLSSNSKKPRNTFRLKGINRN